MPPGRLLVGHRGIPGGGLEPFAVTARLSSGQHNSLDLTIWPSRRNADGARGASARPGLAGASDLRGWNVAPGSRCVRNQQADRGPHDAVDHHHGAGVTVRTLPQRPPGQRLEPLAVVTGRFGRWGWRHPEQLPAALEFPRAVTVAEEAVVPDAMEPARQDMDQETADELRAIERHHLLAVAVPVILPAEA